MIGPYRRVPDDDRDPPPRGLARRGRVRDGVAAGAVSRYFEMMIEAKPFAPRIVKDVNMHLSRSRPT